jgi:O-antigen/teichoic acid export membrane protein
MSRWIALTTLPAAGLNIALNAAWIPEYGMTGAAWATVTSHGLAMLGTSVLARRTRKIPFKYVRAALLLGGVATTLYLGTGQPLGVRIAAILTFGCLLFLLDGRDILAAGRSLRRQQKDRSS